MNPSKKRIRTEDTNPGPGAVSSLRIPTSMDFKNNNNNNNKNEHNNFEIDSRLLITCF